MLKNFDVIVISITVNKYKFYNLEEQSRTKVTEKEYIYTNSISLEISTMKVIANILALHKIYEVIDENFDSMTFY